MATADSEPARFSWRALGRRLRRRPVSSPAPRSAPARPAGRVRLEHTNVGRVMDELVVRAKRRGARRSLGPDYDMLRANFDYMAYMLQLDKLLETSYLDPVAVFLRRGAESQIAPDINFSMGEYLRRYPERAEGPERSPYLDWIKRGRDSGEIADPAPGLEMIAETLERPESELVNEISAIRTDVFQRLLHGTLGEMLAKAAEIEPQVARVWSQAATPRILPFVSRELSATMAAFRDCHLQAEYRRARVVLVVIGPRWGGGRRAEGHIAHALASGIGSDDIVVIYTDQGGETPKGRFPKGVRIVDLARAADERGLRPEDRARLLAELLRSLGADAIVNVNSKLFYETMGVYKAALGASERIFHVMFCNDQGVRGNWGGHPLKQFYRYIDNSAGVIVDSWYLRNWLLDFYLLGDDYADKVSVFSAPVDVSLSMATAPERAPGLRPKVYWAGRLDRQKLPSVLFAIARSLPDVDFHVWGESVLQTYAPQRVPSNVTLEGPYGDFKDLDLSQVDVWLYTSAWDGVPSQLLEVAMTGVPIVGSLVGGTGEVLGEEAWAIADYQNAEAYVSAIREVLADPREARRRALLLRERVVRDRAADDYQKKVMAVLLGDGGA